MAAKKLDQMTVDELSELKLKLRSDYQAAVEGANMVQRTKIHREHIDEATKQVTRAAEAEGRTPDAQARYWLSQEYKDPGRHIMARRHLHQRIVNAIDLEALAAEDANNG